MCWGAMGARRSQTFMSSLLNARILPLSTLVLLRYGFEDSALQPL